MVWVFLGLMLIFLVLSIVFYIGKGGILIAGYNTLPKEDQEKYDAAALGKFMGKSMFAMTGVIGLWAVAGYFMIDWLFHVGTGLIILIVIFMIVYVNTGNRFIKKT